MVLITIVTGAYKPTYNWGASHCNIFNVLQYGFWSLRDSTNFRTNRSLNVPDLLGWTLRVFGFFGIGVDYSSDEQLW